MDLPAPSHESIRLELQKILESSAFATAARSRRFLSWVTEKTLAGGADEIKEFVVGIEVFDRAGDFDPKVDTIVRVEAGKLRKRLDEYYGRDGASGPVRIAMAKGSYVPSFELCAVPAPARTPFLWSKYATATGILALAVAAGILYRNAGSPSPPEPTVAVLPFVNFSSDPANEYFADGLTEDLTDALARLGGMRVASRTSAFTFKGKHPDIHEVGSRLQAAYVVEGSVRKEGQRIKISAQLVRTGDGYHVWSNSFERELKDVFAVQREIAESVASTLNQKLTGAKKDRLDPYTANVEAFDLYLRGHHAVASPIPSAIDEAEKLLHQASAADPAYPLPYVALAQLYLGADIYELRPTPVLVGKAREAISKALALDSRIAEAHVILASLAARHEYDWVAAERHVRDALELEPNLAAAHFALAQNVFAPQGRWQEAEAEQQRAMELDPGSPLGAVSKPFLEQLQGHYDAAIAGFQKYAVTNPLDPTPGWFIAGSLAAKGDYAAAFPIYEVLLKKRPFPIQIAVSGFEHARAGQIDEAEKAMERLTAISKTRFVSSSALAVISLGLNDLDHAFEYLERARQDQESFLIFARVSPFYVAVHTDPRYRTLLSELRLDDTSISKNQALGSRIHR